MARDLLSVLHPFHDGLWQELEALGQERDRARESLKAVVSVLLAVGVASAFHLPDIIWAALSGFLVMRSSLAEALPRAANRVLGTLAGAALGLCLARWVASDPGLLMAALFAITWVAVFQGSVSPYRYGWILFGVTAIMVMASALGAPSAAVSFAATRAAEVAIGSVAALVVAAIFEAFGAPPGSAAPQGLVTREAALAWGSLLDETWLERNWPLVRHATQAAIALGLLPLVWRWFGITDFVQTAVTSCIVMIVPLEAIASGDRAPVYERIAHRTLGCVCGGILGLLSLPLAGDDLLLWVLCLSAAVWVGFHIQSGTTGLSYFGTQFTFAFLVTFVQGPGPATSLTPPLERLLGVIIGSVMMTMVILLWPRDASAEESRPA